MKEWFPYYHSFAQNLQKFAYDFMQLRFFGNKLKHRVCVFRENDKNSCRIAFVLLKNFNKYDNDLWYRVISAWIWWKICVKNTIPFKFWVENQFLKFKSIQFHFHLDLPNLKPRNRYFQLILLNLKLIQNDCTWI